MPGVFRRHTFAFKNMAQVPLAVGAGDLHPAHAQRGVRVPVDGARDFIVKRGPAAAAVKLVGGLVQGRIAAPADKQTFAFVVPVFAGERPFGALFFNDVGLLRAEYVPILFVIVHLSC